jgi:hypothetical protein
MDSKLSESSAGHTRNNSDSVFSREDIAKQALAKVLQQKNLRNPSQTDVGEGTKKVSSFGQLMLGIYQEKEKNE